MLNLLSGAYTSAPKKLPVASNQNVSLSENTSHSPKAPKFSGKEDSFEPQRRPKADELIAIIRAEKTQTNAADSTSTNVPSKEANPQQSSQKETAKEKMTSTPWHTQKPVLDKEIDSVAQFWWAAGGEHLKLRPQIDKTAIKQAVSKHLNPDPTK